LFHPVGSKVSRHAFDAHFDVLDLRLRHRPNHHSKQNEKRNILPVHPRSFF
jgi:hypothetical protein